jgi:hypothetical protein
MPNIVDANGEITLNGSRVYERIFCQIDEDAGDVRALIGMNKKAKYNPKGSIITPINANLDMRLFIEPSLVKKFFPF